VDKNGAPVTNITSPVTVTLDNNQVITIGVNQSSGTVSTTAPDDVYKGDQTVTTGIKKSPVASTLKTWFRVPIKSPPS
jgi:hypothetical protein